VLHDVILIAAERLGQLRDPDRLKPWLFAILRNEVYRRKKTLRRTIATNSCSSFRSARGSVGTTWPTPLA
jgi:DNA-directed RNA polymerase specialized sigma24 family protein